MPPKKHAAATGDLVVMDFEGEVGGKPFEGGKGEDMSVELGSGRLIPGFEDQLVGAKAGDTREVNVTFPDDYPVENLKGKNAIFAVHREGREDLPARPKSTRNSQSPSALTTLTS